MAPKVKTEQEWIDYINRQRAAQKKWRAANKEKMKEANKRWRSKNVEKVKNYRRKYNQRKWALEKAARAALRAKGLI